MEGRTMLGSLLWFDVNSGEGEVAVDNGEALYLHFTSIVGIGKNNYQYPSEADKILLTNLKAGDPCRITVYENVYSRRVEACNFDLTSIDE